MTLKTRAHRAARQRRCVLIAGETAEGGYFHLAPLAGRGRSRRLRVRGIIGESECVATPPHPRPSPRKRGEGEVERGEIAEVWVNCASCHCEEPTRRSNPFFSLLHGLLRSA